MLDGLVGCVRAGWGVWFARPVVEDAARKFGVQRVVWVDYPVRDEWRGRCRWAHHGRQLPRALMCVEISDCGFVAVHKPPLTDVLFSFTLNLWSDSGQ
jgi:hypothetical protein